MGFDWISKGSPCLGAMESLPKNRDRELEPSLYDFDGLSISLGARVPYVQDNRGGAYLNMVSLSDFT